MKQFAYIFTCLLSSSAFAAEEVKVFDSKGLSSVEVENTSGKVTVMSTEGDKASVGALKNKFSDKCKMTMDKSGHKLVVKVEKNTGEFSAEDCDVDLQVKVPKKANLKLIVGSGKLTINDVEGELEFKNGSGSLVAIGKFSKIDGKTGSGRVIVKGLTGGGEIKSGSGEVDLTFAVSPTKGDIDLKTGSGSATLVFPQGTKIKTKYKAGMGSYINELGETPNAAFEVSMKTGSGNLTIKAE